MPRTIDHARGPGIDATMRGLWLVLCASHPRARVLPAAPLHMAHWRASRHECVVRAPALDPGGTRTQVAATAVLVAMQTAMAVKAVRLVARGVGGEVAASRGDGARGGCEAWGTNVGGVEAADVGGHRLGARH